MIYFTKKIKFTYLNGIILISIIALFSRPYGFNFLPYFEILFTVFSLIYILKIKKIALPVFLLFLAYIMFSFSYAIVFSKNHIFDFLQAYKAFWYLLLFVPFINKTIISKDNFMIFYKIFMTIFFLRYLFVFCFVTRRPVLFYENNYELMFLSILILLKYEIKLKLNFWEQIVITFIFLVSESRSGLLIYIFMMTYVNRKLILKYLKYILPFILIIGVIIIQIFKSRNQGTLDLENVDRYRLLMSFFYETRNWGWINWFFGTPRLTPLSDITCSQYTYYPKLFSYNEDGSCYAVMFHSYITRVIFDHGILGLFALLFFNYKFLLWSGRKKSTIILILAIGLINGLSVSSFNSIFFVLGTSIALLLESTNYAKNEISK